MKAELGLALGSAVLAVLAHSTVSLVAWVVAALAGGFCAGLSLGSKRTLTLEKKLHETQTTLAAIREWAGEVASVRDFELSELKDLLYPDGGGE